MKTNDNQRFTLGRIGPDLTDPIGSVPTPHRPCQASPTSTRGAGYRGQSETTAATGTGTPSCIDPRECNPSSSQGIDGRHSTHLHVNMIPRASMCALATTKCEPLADDIPARSRSPCLACELDTSVPPHPLSTLHTHASTIASSSDFLPHTASAAAATTEFSMPPLPCGSPRTMRK